MKQSPLHSINPDELKDALTKNKTIIIDVRTDAEYTQEHIPGSFHVPLDTIAEHKQALAKIGKPVTFVCRSDGLAGTTGVLRTDVAMDEEARRFDIQLFTDILTDLDQILSALATGAGFRFMAVLDARQVPG